MASVIARLSLGAPMIDGPRRQPKAGVIAEAYWRVRFDPNESELPLGVEPFRRGVSSQARSSGA